LNSVQIFLISEKILSKGVFYSFVILTHPHKIKLAFEDDLLPTGFPQRFRRNATTRTNTDYKIKCLTSPFLLIFHLTFDIPRSLWIPSNICHFMCKCLYFLITVPTLPPTFIQSLIAQGFVGDTYGTAPWSFLHSK
jgi:hypothetical protein